MNFSTLTHQGRQGRPSLVTTQAADEIIDALRRGSYIKPACEASGVSYEAFRNWVLKGEADAEAGIDSAYAQFRDRLTRARAEGEVNLVRKLEDNPDWRAAAFLLERGPARQRWGKHEELGAAPASIQLSNEQMAALLEGLRYVAERDARTIETQASNGGGETPPKR
jgi:hypothetical protein